MGYSFKGAGVAIVTPFLEDLSIDYEAFEKIINHTIGGGINYIVVLGTTGESVTLNKEEQKKLVEFALEKIDGRVPVIVGIGSNNTSTVVESVKGFDLTGVAAILSVAPYYNKPSQTGLYHHYKAIAEATDKAIMLYNVPGRTASNISSDTVVALAKDFDNIVAIKEASGDLVQIARIIRDKPHNFEVVSGDDALTLPIISLGGVGGISVAANSHPQEYATLVNSALNNDYNTARHLHHKLLGYIEALFTEGSPSGIKAAMEISGYCENIVRLPVSTVSEEHYIKLQKILNQF